MTAPLREVARDRNPDYLVKMLAQLSSAVKGGGRPALRERTRVAKLALRFSPHRPRFAAHLDFIEFISIDASERE